MERDKMLIRNRLIIISLIAFIGFQIVFFASPIGEGEKYFDKRDRYSISFPDGWERTSFQGVDVIYLDSIEDDSRENINIISAKEYGVKDSESYVIDMAYKAIDELEEMYPGTTTVTRPVAKIINEHWSATYVIDFVYQGVTFRESQTLIVSEGYSMIFIITCTSSPSSFKAYQDIFNESINSFEILNEPSPSSFIEGLIISVIIGSLAGGGVALGIYLYISETKKKQEVDSNINTGLQTIGQPYQESWSSENAVAVEPIPEEIPDNSYSEQRE
jgi:hypothetical protein